jgi:hypothetical protein
MMTAKRLLRGTGVFFMVAILIVFAMSIGVQGVQQPSDAHKNLRADIVTIDALKSFGELERPRVVFLHEKHSDAVEKRNENCTACHLKDKDRQSLKFKRLEDTSRKASMDNYHTECIGCHQETAAPQKSGPVTCGECHTDKREVSTSWHPIGMDKSLHYRHTKALDNKCEQCHHQYDARTKSLVYVKGKEATCRYCHGQVTEENRISMQLASHLACIDCHQNQLAQNKSAGPQKCSGCHEPREQKLIEVVKNVPRMQLNQPDVVLIKKRKGQATAPGSAAASRMNAVPFNHKGHEEYNNTCRVCHHADLNACIQCHTPEGSQEGKQVKLEQAMHQLQAEQSCLGCHGINQREPKCAGCHATIDRPLKKDDATCLACHMTPVAQAASADTALKPDRKLQAAQLLTSRPAVTGTYPDEDIPEKVKIKVLSENYEPVEMPHRKIVHALVDNIKDNPMVRYFHGTPGTLCQGCHHNSPSSKNPPQCGTCHGKPFDANYPLRPGLMGAYHQQCMECHSDMELKKPVATDCEACHKKK